MMDPKLAISMLSNVTKDDEMALKRILELPAARVKLKTQLRSSPMRPNHLVGLVIMPDDLIYIVGKVQINEFSLIEFSGFLGWIETALIEV